MGHSAFPGYLLNKSGSDCFRNNIQNQQTFFLQNNKLSGGNENSLTLWPDGLDVVLGTRRYPFES